MFNTILKEDLSIDVDYKSHRLSYSTDGTLPNPLEALYAAINGCAAVFAIKYCKQNKISHAGIRIESKPVATPDNPYMPVRFETTVHFPESVTDMHKSGIIDSIKHCIVKELIQKGHQIEFEMKIN